jgi:hypothetical protein
MRVMRGETVALNDIEVYYETEIHGDKLKLTSPLATM